MSSKESFGQKLMAAAWAETRGRETLKTEKRALKCNVWVREGGREENPKGLMGIIHDKKHIHILINKDRNMRQQGKGC